MPKFSRKILLSIVLSIISCLGTSYYGYHFADFLKPYSYSLFFIFSLLFSFFASFANAALGMVSLLNFPAKKNLSPYILLLSCLSAIPTGILSYFAFKIYLFFFINVILMIAIILTNMSINYMAVLNSINQLQALIQQKESIDKKTVRTLGLSIGVMVSLSFYMATINGINELFNLYMANEVAFNLACLTGFVIWLPNAALFGNSTQQCIGQFYSWMRDRSQSIKKITMIQLTIFILALFSASAYTEIAIIFFDAKMNIPAFFKWDSVQFFIYHYLVPMAFLSAFSVNYLALMSLLKKFTHK